MKESSILATIPRKLLISWFFYNFFRICKSPSQNCWIKFNDSSVQKHPQRVIASGSPYVYLCVFEKGDIMTKQTQAAVRNTAQQLQTSVNTNSFGLNNQSANSFQSKFGTNANNNMFPQGPQLSLDQYGMTASNFGATNPQQNFQGYNGYQTASNNQAAPIPGGFSSPYGFIPPASSLNTTQPVAFGSNANSFGNGITPTTGYGFNSTGQGTQPPVNQQMYTPGNNGNTNLYGFGASNQNQTNHNQFGGYGYGTNNNENFGF